MGIVNQFLHGYYHTHHSNIKRTFAEVTPENESKALFTLYGVTEKFIRTPCMFQVGDVMSVSKER